MTEANIARLSRRAFMATSAVAGLAATRAHSTVTPRLRAGLIGRGTGGRQLLAALSAASGTLDLLAVAGHDSEETPWHRLVERDDLEAVLIATPDHCHAEMATAALRAGKHVYVLPPFSRTGKEAQQLEALALESDRVLHVAMDPAENSRWASARGAREQTGAPLWIEASTPWEVPPADTHWRRQRHCSHGPAGRRIYNMLYPLQFHLDLGVPERATALGGVFAGKPEATPDRLLMTLRYENDATVVLSDQPPGAGRESKCSLRGLQDQVAIPLRATSGGLAEDLALFVATIAGNRQTADKRLRAATIAQEAVCRAMDLWERCDTERLT